MYYNLKDMMLILYFEGQDFHLNSIVLLERMKKCLVRDKRVIILRKT